MKKNRYPVLAAILALAGAAVFSPKAVLAAEGEKISQGVYIGDVDVSGMTEEEAKQAVEDSQRHCAGECSVSGFRGVEFHIAQLVVALVQIKIIHS